MIRHINRTGGLLFFTIFCMIGGIKNAATQNTSVVDEFCKTSCSCCAKNKCLPSTDICAEGCKEKHHGARCINLCPNTCRACIDRPNPDNLDKLNGVSECLSCIDGHFSSVDLYQCQTKCPGECQTCESETNCTLCKPGNYLSKSQPGLCMPCQEGCVTCVSEKKCNSCSQGYFLHQPLEKETVCMKCSNGCVSCTSQSNCLKCQTGHYGVICQNSCSIGCKNNQCLQKDGHCNCTLGFTGEKCDTCVIGMHGYECNLTCPENCLNNKCIRESGECLFCDEQYAGIFCENCINGYHGMNCNLNCSASCFPIICERFGGFCVGCKENYVGGKCEECKAGKYGNDCNIDCPHNCLNYTCNRDNGTCFNCSQNTFGPKCDSCVDTFYGPECLQQCSSRCRNSTCNQKTGMCLYGCEDGFSGETCCLNNSFCEKCSSNETCSECISGKFGEKCEDNCTESCADQRCDKETGVCLKNTTSTGVNVTSIVAPILPTVTLVVIVAVLVLFRERLIFPIFKKHKMSTTDGSITFPMLTSDERNKEQTIQYENRTSRLISQVFDGVDHKVKVNQLATYVSAKTKDSYTMEFKDLPDGLIKPCTDARKPENIAKNRYQSIYPYDEHRVKLTGPGSDFINACYIDGFDRKKEYIASLGPIMKATENFILFWRMLWQEKVEKIVMVTNLIENGTMKCEQYWPSIGNTDCYGDITVTCHSEDVYSDYTRRTFTVAKGKIQRSLTHLHFTAWPDKCVPDDVTSLIEFRQKVKATKVTLGGPTIVHCSAGVGRTGTFIALDRLTKEGEKERAVDVFQCVYNMRQQRTKMVQTEVQYEYLHHAIVHSLTFGCDAIPAEKFKEYVTSCSDKVMQSKFEQMNDNKEKLSENEKTATINNKQREELNRFDADIPGNCHRIWLYEGRTSEETDYINAVYVNGYKQKNRYIVAQTPLPRTVADFITMVIQERISCILSMDVGNTLDKNVGRYIPNDNQALKIGQFEISSSKVASNSCYTLKKLTVCWKAKAIVRTIPHYQSTHWSDNMKVPADITLFLQLIRDVEKKADKDSNKGPILVHCLNGAEKSGLFCAVSILLQKMEIEHEVSVVNTLRQLKVRRALAIPNKEQYVFCHECVCRFLDTFDANVYSNFALQGK